MTASTSGDYRTEVRAPRILTTKVFDLLQYTVQKRSTQLQSFWNVTRPARRLTRLRVLQKLPEKKNKNGELQSPEFEEISIQEVLNRGLNQALRYAGEIPDQSPTKVICCVGIGGLLDYGGWMEETAE